MAAPFMKAVVPLFLLLTLACCVTDVEAQNPKAYPVATDFSADNKVLELTIPAELDGERFVVAWNAGTDQSLFWRVARAAASSLDY